MNRTIGTYIVSIAALLLMPSLAFADILHIVRKGETLASIARQYGISINDIQKLNNLKAKARIKPDYELTVKKTSLLTYRTHRGDTLSRVSKRFGISVAEIKRINELDSARIKPGINLVLEEEPPVIKQSTLAEDLRLIGGLLNAAQVQNIEPIAENDTNLVDQLIDKAKDMIGIPYRRGGTSERGIDCSAFVKSVFSYLNIFLPRVAREQFHVGVPVAKEELKAGDLLFFHTYAKFPSHVGIYLGDNLFIHTSAKLKKITIDRFDTPYYVKRFIGAKRVMLTESDRPGRFDEEIISNTIID